METLTSSSGTETSQESTSTFGSDDLTETRDHTLVVDFRRQLDSGLDDINGSHGTVGDGTTDSTGNSETGIQVGTGRGSGVITSSGGDEELLLRNHDGKREG
jgi:hypothetical protein